MANNQPRVTPNPIAVDDAAGAGENATIVIQVLANDLAGGAKQLYSLNQAHPEIVATSAYSQAGASLSLASDGTVIYNASGARIDSLAAGQTLVDTFLYTLRVANGTLSTATVTVTLTGSNDGPVVVSADLSGSVTEMLVPAGNLTDSGTIAFSDVDLTDSHTVSAAAIGAAIGSLSVQEDSDTTGSGGGGQLTWTYSVAAGALESMAAGETRVESFNVTVDDGHGGAVTRQVDVTLNGTNDGVVIGAADLAGAVVEAGAPAGNLTDSGSIAFSDVDLSDSHTVAASAVGATVGSLTVQRDSDTTGTGTGGQLTWAYSVAAAAVESLAEGEQKLESFDITIDDGNGGAVSRRVDVTITGTNDGPAIVAADLSGGVTEMATAAGNLTDSGGIDFVDVDSSDTHTVSAAALGSTWGSLGVALNSDSTGSGTGGHLTWTYSVAASALEGMAANQTRVESFTVTLDDGHGGTVQRQVDVTLTGTNDAPAPSADAATTNEDTPLTLNVLANDLDPDGDALSIAGLSGGLTSSGALISVVNGQIVYDPRGSSTLQALNSGQSMVDSFSYSVTDGAATSTATVSVTVQGVTDGPRANNDTVSTSEDNRIYIDVLANDTGIGGKSITGLSGSQSAYGANIAIADGKIFYDPQNAAAIQALNTGQTLQDSFSYTMRDGTGATSTATVTVNVSGFTEGTVINSGVSGVMTFNSASVSSNPLSYSEAGMTVQSLYPPSSGPHLHFSSFNGDPTVELWNHSGCCSTPYEFRYYNPANTDTTFSLASLDHYGGGGTWTSSRGGSVAVTAPGTVSFAGNALFQDVEWVRWNVTGSIFSSSNDYIDNFRFTA